MEYFFTTRKSPERDCFAEHDMIGGAITVYLGEFTAFQPHVYAFGKARDDMIAAFLCAVLIHEEFHELITQEVDTAGDQEHDTVYKWIKEFLDRED